MSLTSELVEGCFLVTVEGLVFEVKGVVHPAGRVIAYLRYFPDPDGERHSSDGVGYTKVTSFEERNEYLRRNASEYLWFDAVRGREMEAVALQRVAYVLDPVRTLAQLRDTGVHVNSLQRASVRLAELMVRIGGIRWTDLGITGSQLVGLQTRMSDIDMVVYGECPGRALFQKLRSSRSGLDMVKPYQGEELDHHVYFRWRGIPEFAGKMKEREERKLLQGFFGKYEFFIRLVKKPEEYMYKYDDLLIEPAGNMETTCYILDDRDSIFTPCEYVVSSKDIPSLLKIISYRGRFAEHARSGENVKVRGRLESVKHVPTADRYLQLVLGESETDYMVAL